MLNNIDNEKMITSLIDKEFWWACAGTGTGVGAAFLLVSLGLYESSILQVVDRSVVFPVVIVLFVVSVLCVVVATYYAVRSTRMLVADSSKNTK